MATTQGIYITILGMVILFAALLILMLAAMGLERLFRPKKLEEGKIPPQREKEAVAAIAVAIALKLKRQTLNVKRKTSEQALSNWKLGGRYRQLLNSRGIKRHRG
jgi:Na+-transporting methylmalonyl-CoA/oxaloacetate decarboxylase gamma subunit